MVTSKLDDILEKRPLVSIYATVYNNGSRAERSLNSIISQFKDFDENFELVIVDNYSNDGTYEVLNLYAKEHSNIVLLREKCSRGRGKALAYKNTKGKYVFRVDLDCIYTEVLSRVVYANLKTYKTNTMLIVLDFADRKTMDKLGDWMDANLCEDWELYARAVSKGVKIYYVPSLLSYNEMVEEMVFSKSHAKKAKTGMFSKTYFVREYRYFTGLGHLSRVVKDFYDEMRGRGFNRLSDIEYIKSKQPLNAFLKTLFVLFLTMIKLGVTESYRYDPAVDNTNYVMKNERILNPRTYGVPKRYWLYDLSLDQPSGIINRQVNALYGLGFDKFFYTGRLLVFHTKQTKRAILEYAEKFFS